MTSTPDVVLHGDVGADAIVDLAHGAAPRGPIDPAQQPRRTPVRAWLPDLLRISGAHHWLLSNHSNTALWSSCDPISRCTYSVAQISSPSTEISREIQDREYALLSIWICAFVHDG
jgi:hypothetical protein